MSSSAGPSSSGPTAGAALAASRGIYAQPLPSSVMFPIRSVVEPSASLDGVIYEPKPVVYITWKAALVGAGVGVFGATFQNAYFNRGKEWLPIFTQYGRTIGLFTAIMPAYATTRAVVANVRQKDHWTNAAAGGCAAGFLIGLRGGRLVPALAGCMLGAPVMGWYEYTVPPGSSVRKEDDALERYERLEARHLQRKKWEDISPPPGQGYGPAAYPGYNKSYTENGVY